MEKTYNLLKEIKNNPENYELFAELSKSLDEEKIKIIKKDDKFYELLKELLINETLTSFLDLIFTIDKDVIKELNLKKEDIKIIKNLININENNYIALKELLKQDRNLLLEILTDHPVIYKRWIDEIYYDIELMKHMIKIDPDLIFFAKEEILQDETFMFDFIKKGESLNKIRGNYILKYKEMIISLQGERAFDELLIGIKVSREISHITFGNTKMAREICDIYNEENLKIQKEIDKKTSIKLNINNPLAMRQYKLIRSRTIKAIIKDKIKSFGNKIFEITLLPLVGDYYTYINSIRIREIKTAEDLKKILKKYSLFDEEKISPSLIDDAVEKHFTSLIQLLDLDIKTNYYSLRIFAKEAIPLIYNLIKNNKIEQFFSIYKDMTSCDFSLNIINLMVEDNEFLSLIANSGSHLVKCNKNMMNKLIYLYNAMAKIDNEKNRRLRILENLNKLEIIKMLDITNLTDEDIKSLFRIGYSEVVDGVYSLDIFEEEDDLKNFGKYNIGFYPKTMDDLKKYEQKNSINCSLQLSSKNIPKKQIKSIIFTKYFNMNFEEAQKQYKNLIKNLENIEQYPTLKKFKDLYELIAEENVYEKLLYLFYSLEKSQLKNNLIDFVKESNLVKQEYFKEIMSTVTPKPQESNDNVIVIDENFNGGQFNMLVHVVAAYGNLTEKDVYSSWFTDKFATNNSLCCSYISNDNLGTAKRKRSSVIFGFTDLEADALELMSPNDLKSKDLDAERESVFAKSKYLKDHTRYGHNELTIRRRKGKFGNEKISPSYIVCFDHINQESKKASEDFKIPIYLIKTESIVKNEFNKIEKLKEEFARTLNINLIEEIIVKQENNTAGLHFNPKLQQKYFSQEYRQNNINFICEVILKEINENFRYDELKELILKTINVLNYEKDKYVLKQDSAKRYREFDLEIKNIINLLVEEFKKAKANTDEPPKKTN